jgi:hypothetical protein
MKYEINSSLEVRIWYEDGEAPNIYQPTWPDGTPWASKKEAEAWAKQSILSIQDPTADYPGVSPSQPVIPRATTTIQDQLQAAGFSLDEVKAALLGN